MKKFISGILLYILFWSVLFFSGRHMLFVQEQLQMFQNSWQYIFQAATDSPGGLARVIAEAFVQFCHVSWMGASMISALALFSVLAFEKCLAAITGRMKGTLILAVSPVIPLLYCSVACVDTFPLAAFALTAAVSALVLNISGKHLTVAASVVSPALYLIAGQTAVLLPLTASVVSVLRSGNFSKRLIGLTPVVIYLIFGFAAVRMNLTGPFKEFILYPYPLYESLSNSSFNHFVTMAWAFALAASAVSAFLSEKGPESGKTVPAIISGVTLALVSGLILVLCPSKRYAENVDYPMYSRWARLHHLYSEEKYPDMLEIYKEDVPTNSLESNYINLALYKTGKLATDFFRYKPSWQHFSLRSSWIDMQFPFPFVWVETCNEMGALSKAQQSAFEGNVMAGPGGSSPLVKYLAEAEIIRGSYDAADRYLSCLENTLFYRKWASEQRKFLSDGQVNDNPYYSSKRKCLYSETRTLYDLNDLWLMQDILKNNPSHKSTFYYAGIMVLAAGEIGTFVDFIIKMTEAGAVTLPLPPIFQDAMVMAFPKNQQLLDLYKVDKERLNDYAAFHAAANGKVQNKLNSQSIMSKNQDRLWYYVNTLMRNNAAKKK